MDKKTKKASYAASIIKCLSQELTEKEVEKLENLKDSILKRIAKK